MEQSKVCCYVIEGSGVGRVWNTKANTDKAQTKMEENQNVQN